MQEKANIKLSSISIAEYNIGSIINTTNTKVELRDVKIEENKYHTSLINIEDGSLLIGKGVIVERNEGQEATEKFINVGEDIAVEEEGEFKGAENKIIRSETLKQTIVSSKWNYILEEKSKITIIDNEIIVGRNIEANTNIISVLTLSNGKNIKTKESLITIADNKITGDKREEKSNNLYGIYSYNTDAIFMQVSSKFDTDSKIEKIAFGSEDGKGKIMSDWDIEHVEDITIYNKVFSTDRVRIETL